jgi:hypothetical protein
MALQLYVKLQTPTIELQVKAKDASGTKDSLVVGFKRYDLKETEGKFKALQSILEDIQDENNLNSETLNKFIKDEIVYLKSVKVEVYDKEKETTKELSIVDTRTTKPVETLWETPDDCLDVLLGYYLASAPYRVSLISAMQKALLNNDYESAEVKN